MRWRNAAGTVIAMVMTGCPFEWGKGGWVDKQVHKTEVELIVPRCSERDRQLYCGGDKKDSPKCHEMCGE